MARVFISHASPDLGVAVRVREWLRAAGHVVFLDRDLEEGLRVGDAWRERLYQELYRADALVCLLTAAFADSPWCAAEVGIAQAYGLRVLPVVAEPGARHRLVSTDTYWADLTAGEEAARAELTEALRLIDSAGALAWSREGSPYPGLQAFDAGMARVFFGRQAETRRLAERLRAPAPHSAGLVVVVGPSGSGKSSLVRAGLTPLLGADPAWLVLPALVPGTDPAAALARVLAAAGQARNLGWTAESAGAALAGLGGLGGLADQLAGTTAGSRVLVVVDQAEELLTRAGAAERSRFIALLAGGAGGVVRAVATLRSEFLDPLLTLTATAGVQVAPFPLAPLDREMLPQVITGPARQAGIGVDDELVARLVADTGGGEALPLLAFVLDRLALGVERGGKLSAARYDDLGGVRGALSAHADSALAAACMATGRTHDQVLAGLLHLVTIDDSGQVTRRRAYRDDLPDPVRTEVEAFVVARLLTTSADPGTGSPVVAVAHEKVLTAWPPLADAIAGSADTLRLRRSVEDAAADWDTRNRPADHLWEPGRISAAEQVLGPSDLTPAAAAFLRAGHRQGRRRRARATAVLSTLLVLALVTAGIAIVQQRSARDEQRRAEISRASATARALSVAADLRREADPKTALLLGVAAESIAPGAETRGNLLHTLTSTHYAGELLVPVAEGPVSTLAYTEDGGTLAVASTTVTPDASGVGRVTLWDNSQPDHPRLLGRPIDVPELVSSLDFSEELGILAIGASGYVFDYNSTGSLGGSVGHDAGRVVLIDVSDRASPRTLSDAGQTITSGRPVQSVAFSSDGRVLAVASTIPPHDSSSVELWKVENGATPVRLQKITLGDSDSIVLAAELSPDGKILAVSEEAGIYGDPRDTTRHVGLWDTTRPTHPEQIGEIEVPSSITSLSFAPDGNTLAVGTSTAESRSVMLWDVTRPEKPSMLGEPLATGASVRTLLAFSADGRTLAAAVSREGSGGAVFFWDLTHRSLPHQLGSPLSIDRPVAALDFTGPGPLVAVGSSDGEGGGRLVFASRSNPGMPNLTQTLGIPQGQTARPLAITSDGRALAVVGSRSSGEEDRKVVLLDITDQNRPTVLEPPVSAISAVFSPDGRTLAVGGGVFTDTVSGFLALWDVSRSIPRPLSEPQTTYDVVQALAMSPDGRTLAVGQSSTATGDGSGGVLLWDITSRGHPRQFAELQTHSGGVTTAIFSPDGGSIAAGTDTGEVFMWDLSDLRHPRQTGNPLPIAGPVSSLSYSPDGGSLMVGTGNVSSVAQAGLAGSVVFWDVADPARPVQLGPPLATRGPVSTAMFLPDGQTVAAGIYLYTDDDVDGLISLWDLSDRRRPRPLAELGAPGPVSSFAPMRDGRTVLAGVESDHEDTYEYNNENDGNEDDEGKLVVWDIEPLDLLRSQALRTACRLTGRGLTREEWKLYVPEIPYRDTCHSD